jgi:hypothetical protein
MENSIAIDLKLKDIMYQSMNWQKENGYWRPKSKVEKTRHIDHKTHIMKPAKPHNLKTNRTCYVCGELHPKTEMHLQEYLCTRRTGIKIGKKAINKIYRCEKCHAKYEPKNSYTTRHQPA